MYAMSVLLFFANPNSLTRRRLPLTQTRIPTTKTFLMPWFNFQHYYHATFFRHLHRLRRRICVFQSTKCDIVLTMPSSPPSR
uniref:Uncharacterized protein n=1 Tax=Physcomitrium patens TaxID=3218 RepID=A0A2K1K4B7_PHYPA|nr:hypothetical protein PHYPA_013101 [Physcomitrium patens]